MLSFLRSSVRGRLACLILAITLPASLIVLLLVVQSYRNERASVERHLLATARALAAMVESEIGEMEWLLKGLATADTLQAGDIRGFEQRLRALALGEDRWLELADATGQQLINTRFPAGTALPREPVTDELRGALERGATYVSNLAVSAATNSYVLRVSVPLASGGSLSCVMRPQGLSIALPVQRLAPGVVTSVVDRKGRIAVRYPNSERFVGELVTPDMIASVTAKLESTQSSRTLEGLKVVAVHSRGAVTGWSVAMGAPYAALYRSARELLLMGLAASTLLMGVAIFMVVWIARAVVRSVDGLVKDTDALGRGKTPPSRPAALQETDFVSEAMRKTARRLAERERENAQLTVALQADLEREKRAEEASRRLATIVQSSDDAIIGVDTGGLITNWNPGAERIFLFLADEIVGQPVQRLIAREGWGEAASILERIRRGERVEPFETVWRRKDGTPVPASLSISPMRDRGEVVIGGSMIARDISQRKRAEKQQSALFELVATVNRAEELPQIFEAAITAMLHTQHADRAAILLLDQEGVMRFCASRGLSVDYCRAVEGHTPWRAADAQPAPVCIEDVERATLAVELRHAILAEGIRSLVFVPLMVQKRLIGKFMLYYDAPRAFTLEELKPVQAIASQVAFAVERQRNAEALEALVDARTASLREAVAQMEEFSYSVSHDLRAPTRAMCGYAEAILQDHSSGIDPVGRELLTRIRRNGQRMDRLIQDLLSYTRVSRREVQLEPVALEKLVREIVLQYPDLRPERASIEIVGTLSDVIAHEPSLTQVVSNLLNNGVKFVAPGIWPHVRVSCECVEDRVRVSFRDNGIGIKPEAQKRLFRMFERMHPEKNYEGTGIGLAIVRRALERMNGTVGVESDGATGCRFWFELPIAHAPEIPRTDSGQPFAIRPALELTDSA